MVTGLRAPSFKLLHATSYRLKSSDLSFEFMKGSSELTRFCLEGRIEIGDLGFDYCEAVLNLGLASAVLRPRLPGRSGERAGLLAEALSEKVKHWLGRLVEVVGEELVQPAALRLEFCSVALRHETGSVANRDRLLLKEIGHLFAQGGLGGWCWHSVPRMDSLSL